jgi:hypothetical protein
MDWTTQNHNQEIYCKGNWTACTSDSAAKKIFCFHAIKRNAWTPANGANNDQLKGFTVGTANAKLAPVPLQSLNIPSCRGLWVITTDDE